VLGITLAVVVLPMRRRGRLAELGGFAAVAHRLGYFGCIGVGFLLVEIPLLQRFGLWLGHPTWAFSVVLGALLVGAGGGGLLSARVADAAVVRLLPRALAGNVLVLGAAVLATPSLLDATMLWPFGVRVVLAVVTLVPIGVGLGMALPLGVRVVRAHRPGLLPWAFSINGVASVLASILAVVAGVQFGFTAALLGGIGCYGVACLCATRLAR
jgi:hypothetical protein